MHTYNLLLTSLFFSYFLYARYACSIRVVRLLRERGLGNSVSQVQKKLREQHSEDWLCRSAAYLSVCRKFVNNPLLSDFRAVLPPAYQDLARPKWLLSVFVKDVFSRLDEVKAKVTSTYGSVLKLDSTKKVTKKLAGFAAGTAAWATNVSNEFGQVLLTVLTAAEGSRLVDMAQGIVRRYELANQEHPSLLYVDRDCCSLQDGTSPYLRTFSGWPALRVRLDSWHFMRRFAAACTTDSHQLYGIFMSKLSACIFEWDAGDMKELVRAKKSQLEQKELLYRLSDDDALARVSRKEMERHCRRRTRGVEVTTRLIEELLSSFEAERGGDTMGVQLLNAEKMAETWASQSRHIACLQDPEGVPLYTQKDTLTKGGVILPVFRCARGSSSLESFHKFLVNFIPGECLKDTVSCIFPLL